MLAKSVTVEAESAACQVRALGLRVCRTYQSQAQSTSSCNGRFQNMADFVCLTSPRDTKSTLGLPDPIVRKITGHRSRELERYQHLTPELRALTVNLIATELFRATRARKERESGTPTGTVRGSHVTEKPEGRQRTGTKRDGGGVDGTRTL